MQTIELQSECNWTDDWRLDHSEMDGTHREFVALMDAAMRAADATLADRIAELVSHTEQHFALEQRWMSENDFAARDCHVSEHDAVLETMHAVQTRMAGGDVRMGRLLLTAIAQWFDGHANSMDRVLAAWMNARERGDAFVSPGCATNGS